jgi:hypothetical protein
VLSEPVSSEPVSSEPVSSEPVSSEPVPRLNRRPKNGLTQRSSAIRSRSIVTAMFEVPLSATVSQQISRSARQRVALNRVVFGILTIGPVSMTIAAGLLVHSWTMLVSVGIAIGFGALVFLLLRRYLKTPPVPALAFSIDDHAVHFTAIPGQRGGRAAAEDWELGHTSLEVSPKWGGSVDFTMPDRPNRLFTFAALAIDPNQVISRFDSLKAAHTGVPAPHRSPIIFPGPPTP